MYGDWGLGAPTIPSCSYNVVQSGEGTIERGIETYALTELRGAECDRVYDEQVRWYRGFADYAE